MRSQHLKFGEILESFFQFLGFQALRVLFKYHANRFMKSTDLRKGHPLVRNENGKFFPARVSCGYQGKTQKVFAVPPLSYCDYVKLVRSQSVTQTYW